MNLKFLLLAIFAFSQFSFAQVPPPQRPGYCPLIENISCEDRVIQNLSRWEYDDAYEYKQIRNSCAGNYGISCLNLLLDNIPRFDKDDLYEMTKLAGSCQLSSTGCVEFIKNRIPRFDFNDLNDVSEVARACTRSDVNCMSRLCNTRGTNCRSKFDLMNVARQCYTPCY